jgi:DNA-binding LytR/AlgR family response regulator
VVAPIVFTTAHEDYALEAFDAAAVDYLLKPIEADRLLRAIERVRRLAHPLNPSVLDELVLRLAGGTPPPRLAARRGDTLHLLDPRALSRIRAAGDYCAVRHDGSEFLLDETLAELEARLGPLGFLRVHRGELINLHHVRAVRRQDEGAVVELADGDAAPVSRRFVAVLRERLGLPGR